MRLDEYVAHDATSLAGLVRAGDVTPAELRQCALDGLAVVDPILNLLSGDVHADAEGLPDRAFSGVPMLLKEGSGAAGFPLARGSRLAAGLLAPRDGEYVRRLRETGVALLAATTSCEFGAYPVTEGGLHGATRNPWNPDHSPGGSSGGASAAVAAGIVPVAQTSDGGGSTRGPAHCTGIFGLKPSRGRMPDVAGLFGFGVTHVSSRSVRDSAAFLDLTHGPAAGARFQAPTPATSFAAAVVRDPARLRIGIHRTAPGATPLSTESLRAVDATAALLAEAGHTVVESSPAVDWPALHRHFLAVWDHPLPLLVRAYEQASGRTAGPGTLDAMTLRLLEHARTVTVDDLVLAEGVFEATRVAVDTWFAGFDVWLTPTGVGQAPRIGEFDPDGGGDEDPVAYGERILDDYAGFTPIFNVTGHPAASVPVVHGTNGLPVGVQLAAPHGREDTLLAVAAQLERMSPWAPRRPPVSVLGDPAEVAR